MQSDGHTKDQYVPAQCISAVTIWNDSMLLVRRSPKCAGALRNGLTAQIGLTWPPLWLVAFQWQSRRSTLALWTFPLEYVCPIGPVICPALRTVHHVDVLPVIRSRPCRISSTKIDLAVPIDIAGKRRALVRQSSPPDCLRILHAIQPPIDSQ